MGQGKARFEGTLANPQSIVEWFAPDKGGVECEELFCAGAEAYAIVMSEKTLDVELSHPLSPMGEARTATEIVKRFPKVEQRYGVHKLMLDDE